MAFLFMLVPLPSLAERETVQYFYNNACESCHPQEEFAEEFHRLTGEKLSDYEVSYYNVFQSAGLAAYEQAVRDLNEDERKLPLLIMGDKLYSGDTAISLGLEERFGLVMPDNRSVIYFLTATACESCMAVRTLIESLPSVVPVWNKGELISSDVEVREISISAEPEKARSLFERYQVPDDKRYAPAVFMGETYYIGKEQVENEMLSALKAGAALGTPELETAAPDETSVTLLGAIAAGLAAGFNPCALSMLLLFLGMLLSLRKNPLLPGLLYLGVKFTVYLGIGLIFAQLWTRYAPSWFPLAVRIVMTVAGGILIVMNVLDAVNARAQQYGRIRNQLPSALRLRLRSFIQGFAGKGGLWIGAAAVVIGAVVAGGEFLCAGQMYIAVLIANTGSQGTMLQLTAYCLAFLAPGMILLLVVSLTRRTMASSDWILKRMPLIKIFSAVMMAAVILYTWIMK
jgi:hypothetical protein